MIGILAFALAVGTLDEPWPISEKVVQELRVVLKGTNYVVIECGIMLERGHIRAAHQIWEAAGAHLDDPRYKQYQKDKNLEMMLEMVKRAQNRKDDPPLPGPISEALYYRNRQSVLNALAYVVQRRDSGLELDFNAWGQDRMGKGADPVTALCNLFMQESMDEFAYAVALDHLSKSTLSEWVETLTSGSGGDMPGGYPSMLELEFDRFIDSAFAKYPRLMEDEDLFLLSNKISAPGLTTIVVQELLEGPVHEPIKERWFKGGKGGFNRALAIQHETIQLIKSGRADLAVRILDRHRVFLISVFEWMDVFVVDGWAERLVKCGQKDLAVDLTRALEDGLKRELEKSGSSPPNRYPWVVALFYEARGLDAAEAFCALVEAGGEPRIAEMRIQLATHIAKKGRYTEAMNYAFRTVPKYARFTITDCLDHAKEQDSVELVREVADEAIRLMIQSGRFESDQWMTRVLHEHGLTEELLELAQGQFPLPASQYTGEISLTAGFRYAGAGRYEESLEFFERAFVLEATGTAGLPLLWQLYAHTSPAPIVSIGDGRLFELYLTQLRNNDDAIGWGMISILRFCQDDASTVDLLLSSIEELFLMHRKNPDYSLDSILLLDLIDGGERPGFKPNPISLIPLNTDIQDRLLKIIVESR